MLIEFVEKMWMKWTSWFDEDQKDEIDALVINKDNWMECSKWWLKWESEYIEDEVYKLVLYGKMVKVKQGSAAMNHARVKGKQRDWRRRTKAMVKSEWRLRPMDHKRPYEDLSDPYHC